MSKLALVISVCVCNARAARAAPYNETRAIMFANLAGASYCPDAQLQAWECGSKCDAVKQVSSIKICSASWQKAFVAIWEGMCIVSFKGTNSPVDIIKDIQIAHSPMPWNDCPGCQVHRGFLSTYNALRDCVQTALKELGCGPGSSIRTTGHSLGAAVQALAMIDLTSSGRVIQESYDFARPRIGDARTAQFLNSEFGDRTWRITRKRDPIPLLPYYVADLRWTHSMPEVYYKNEVSDGYEICSDPNDHVHCSEKNKMDPLYLFQHEFYMGIKIGTLGCKISIEHAETSDVVV